jgi:uncharacterized damage-inducible protein DinB
MAAHGYCIALCRQSEKNITHRARDTVHPKEDTVRRIYICFLILTAFGLNFISSGRAPDNPDHKVTAMASAAPTSGFRAEFLEEIDDYGQRYTRLAEAMPAEKYAWRPAEGVRSVGDVFAHITLANYGIARALGTAPPAGFDMKAILALSTDKPKLLQTMKDSFLHFRGAIVALNDVDADKPQKMFNRQTTVRGSFIMITGHFGEHLGQSIAYARVNGIVPPWTEEAQQQQQKPADKPKP